VAKKSAAGFGGLISQPASILPGEFADALTTLRQTPAGKSIRIQVGIPEIRSLGGLKFWFLLMGIDYRKHAQAGFLVESFERAKVDGYMEFFSDTWTQYCLEWALSLTDADGVHFMGHSPHILAQATST